MFVKQPVLILSLKGLLVVPNSEVTPINTELDSYVSEILGFREYLIKQPTLLSGQEEKVLWKIANHRWTRGLTGVI